MGNLLTIEQITLATNLNVDGRKDFDVSLTPQKISGYSPIAVYGYDIVGDWDVWINISSCYFNPGKNFIYARGHNSGSGKCSAMLNVFVLYKK